MPNLSGRWPFWYPVPGSPLIPFENNFSTLAQSIADTVDGYDLPIGVGSATERNTLYPTPATGDSVFRRDLGYIETYYPANFFVTGVPAGWQRQGGDSGNLALSLENGWTNVNGVAAPTVRVVGTVVTLNGRINGTGVSNLAFILPVGARPSQERIHTVQRGGNAAETVIIGIGGTVQMFDISPTGAGDYRIATIAPFHRA